MKVVSAPPSAGYHVIIRLLKDGAALEKNNEEQPTVTVAHAQLPLNQSRRAPVHHARHLASMVGVVPVVSRSCGPFYLSLLGLGCGRLPRARSYASTSASAASFARSAMTIFSTSERNMERSWKLRSARREESNDDLPVKIFQLIRSRRRLRPNFTAGKSFV